MDNYKISKSFKMNKNPKNVKLIKDLFITFLLSLLSLTLYEYIKQIIFPRVSIWSSHTITIIVGSIVAVVSSFIVYKNQQKLIDEKEKAKNEVEKALKLRDEFLYTVSHEFKTPLNVIYAAVQAMELLCSDDMSEKAKGYVENIKQNTYRQMKLVNNLLDITKIESGCIVNNEKNIDIVYLTSSIIESISVYANQKGLSLQFIPSFQSKIIAVDEEKYERIFLNLISNAIKFTPKGKAILVKIAKINNHILLEVIDEGVGIPKDKLKIIFQRFKQVENILTRTSEGTGIGLYLVKSLVKLLDWEISVVSQEGVGSSFRVLIPDRTVTNNAEDKLSQYQLEDRITKYATIECSDIF